MSSEGPLAFVLMPFDSRLQPIFDQLMKPALEEAGYVVARADSFLDQQNILQDIIKGIARADLVVADLTWLNPNVMYELGVCHGLGVPTVLLTQSLDDVPFDLRSYRIVTYSDRFDEAVKLRETLTNIGTRHRERNISFGSPVKDFLATSGAEVDVPATSPADQPAAQPDGEQVEGGILDFIVDGQDAANQLTEVLTIISQRTEQLGEDVKKRTERMESVGSDNPKQLLIVVSQAARDMTTYSTDVDARLPELNQAIDSLVENLSKYVATLEIDSAEAYEQGVKARDDALVLRDTVVESLGSVREFRETISELPAISKEINRVKPKVEATLSNVITGFEKVEAFAARTVSLFQGELDKWAASSS